MANFYPQTCFFTHEHSQQPWEPTGLPNGTPSTTSFKFLIGVTVYTLLDLRNKILTMTHTLKWR